jgi:hypothetical protein
MNLVEAVLRRLAEDLLELGVSWAVVGGFAVSARAEPRFTRDVDVAVAVAGDDEAEATIGRLTARGYRLIAMTEQDAVGRLATVRLVPAGTGDEGDIVVDVLFASSALKLLARDDESRPQDRVDLLALRDAAGAADLDIAAEGVEQIRDRGFDRGRDLDNALSALLAGRSTKGDT